MINFHKFQFCMVFLIFQILISFFFVNLTQEELYYWSKSASKKPMNEAEVPIRISSNKAEIRAQVEEKCVFRAPVKKWV